MSEKRCEFLNKSCTQESHIAGKPFDQTCQSCLLANLVGIMLKNQWILRRLAKKENVAVEDLFEKMSIE
jgi:ligand-binding sensor protein